MLQRVIIAWAFYDQGDLSKQKLSYKQRLKMPRIINNLIGFKTTAYGALGDFYFRQGFLEKARDQYIVGDVITSPENYEFYKSLGATHLHLGELDLAEKYLYSCP